MRPVIRVPLAQQDAVSLQGAGIARDEQKSAIMTSQQQQKMNAQVIDKGLKVSSATDEGVSAFAAVSGSEGVHGPSWYSRHSGSGMTMSHLHKSRPQHTGSSTSRMLSKVPSLLFDMEDAPEDGDGNGLQDSVPESEVLARLRNLLAPQDDAEYMLQMHVRFASDDAITRSGSALTVEELGNRLRKLGYNVKLKTALGGDGNGSSCLRNLRHSFLAVTVPNNGGQGEAVSKSLIVDPRFLDQFEIAHPSVRYDCVLSVVPSALVAPMPRLAESVAILCDEMARAFVQAGIPLPPWRQTAAMLSKWQPRRSEEVDVQQAVSGKGQHVVLKKPNVNKATVAQKLALMGVNVQAVETASGSSASDDVWSTVEDEADDSLNSSDSAVSGLIDLKNTEIDSDKSNQDMNNKLGSTIIEEFSGGKGLIFNAPNPATWAL